MWAKLFLFVLLPLAACGQHNIWQDVVLQNPSPSHRMFHTNTPLNVDGCGDLALIFGGIESTLAFNFSKESWIFRIQTNSFIQLEIENSPSARAGHTAVNIENEIIVFGGFDGATTMGDTWAFTYSPCSEVLQSGEWVFIPCTGECPPARWGHSVVAHQSNMYIFGGSPHSWNSCSSVLPPLSDTTLWKFELASRTWSKFDVTGNEPPARMGFVMGLMTNRLVIFSGYNGSSLAAPDAWALDLTADLDNRTWTALTLKFDGFNDHAVAFSSSSTVMRNITLFPLTPSFPLDVIVIYGGLYNVSNMFNFCQEFVETTPQLVFATLEDHAPNTLQFLGANGARPVLSVLNQPGASVGQTILIFQDAFLVHGGLNLYSSNVLNSFWVRSLLLQWTPIWMPIVSDKVMPQFSYAASAVFEDTAIIFGGLYLTYNNVSRLWRFNITAGTITEVPFYETAPSTRWGSVAVALEDSMMVFGGSQPFSDGTVRTVADTWLLDVKSIKLPLPLMVWQVQNMYVAPPARSFAAAVARTHAVNGSVVHMVYMHGGCAVSSVARQQVCSDADTFNDLWVFHYFPPEEGIHLNFWEQLNSTNAPKMFDHVAAIVGEGDRMRMLVYGLYTDATSLFALNFTTLHWTALNPSPRVAKSMNAGMISLSPQLVLLWGQDPDNTSYADFDYFALWDSTFFFRMDVENSYELANRVGGTVFSVNGSARLFTAGGSTSDPSSFESLTVGCRKGTSSSDFLSTPCTACAIGKYANSPGMTMCETCPTPFITASDGADSIDDCNVCPDSICNHGKCVINYHVNPLSHSCSCDFMYSFSEDCSVPVVGLIIGIGVGTLIAVLVVALLVRRLRRSRARFKAESMERQMLCHQARQELQQMQRVFSISPESLIMKKLIATGTFGEVYLAEYEEKPVAVKKLKDMWMSFGTEDLSGEIRIMRMLRHRNVVFFYGGGTFYNGVPFLVTEYLARGSLHDLLQDRKTPLDSSRRFMFLRDCSEGMAFLHGQEPPLIHRDLKSANLLISQTWTLKVADLGTAKLVSQLKKGQAAAAPMSINMDTISPNESGVVGSLLWVAPEIFRDLPYSTMVDVYSFGIVMWEIAERRAPYDGVRRVRDAVLAGQRPPIPAVCCEELTQLMQDCWQENPNQRPTFNMILGHLALISRTTAFKEEVDPEHTA